MRAGGSSKHVVFADFCNTGAAASSAFGAMCHYVCIIGELAAGDGS